MGKPEKMESAMWRKGRWGLKFWEGEGQRAQRIAWKEYLLYEPERTENMVKKNKVRLYKD